MSQKPRPFLRLLLSALAGLLAGFLGVAVTLWSALELLGLPEEEVTGVPVQVAFFGFAAAAVLLVARATARWADPRAGAGSSGVALGGPATAPIETSDELVRLVRNPPPARLPPAFLLVASFLAYMLVAGRGEALQHALIIAAVVALHEAGHALAMRIFGYRDVRVFFVPFLGAATAGTPNPGPGWREGVVLLMGPLPGIVLGASIVFFSGGGATEPVVYAARALILLNAFNLLPVTPLDGGRLLELVLFGRHRFAELALGLASTAALAWLALADKDIILGFLAYLQALALSGGWAIATTGAASARAGLALPPRIEEASTELVDDVNRRLNARWGRHSPSHRASWIRLVIERALYQAHAPGAAGSLALLLGWALTVAFATAVLSSSMQRAGDPGSGEGGGFSYRFNFIDKADQRLRDPPPYEPQVRRNP